MSDHGERLARIETNQEHIMSAIKRIEDKQDEQAKRQNITERALYGISVTATLIAGLAAFYALEIKQAVARVLTNGQIH